MSKIVDRDTFLYYLDNGDVNWEATARECIAKVFELGEENKKLKEKLDKVEEVVLKCIETKYCTDCMFFTGCRRCCKKYILKIIRGAEE